MLLKIWPTWMWANDDVVDLADWLKAYQRRTGK